MGDSVFWLNVLSTLIGAAAGAGVSGIVAWKIYNREEQGKSQTLHRELEEKYEERLTDELANVAGKIQKFLLEVPIALDDIGREKMILSSFLDIAAMKAKGQDLELIQSMAGAALDLDQNTSEKHQLLVWDLITSLYGWRTKVNEIEFYLDKFKAPYQPRQPIILNEIKE